MPNPRQDIVDSANVADSRVLWWNRATCGSDIVKLIVLQADDMERSFGAARASSSSAAVAGVWRVQHLHGRLREQGGICRTGRLEYGIMQATSVSDASVRDRLMRFFERNRCVEVCFDEDDESATFLSSPLSRPSLQLFAHFLIIE